MRRNQPSRILTMALTLLATLSLLARYAPAQEKILYNFGATSTDAMNPTAGLILDSAGNLYGTASFGGSYNCGAVFQLSPNGSGGWTEKLLHAFISGALDGCAPYSSLLLDSHGNLYGTTTFGGPNSVGTVFQLMPKPGGVWVEKVLYSFKQNHTRDGFYPNASVVIDSSGNLYGTTQQGGLTNAGTVFKLTPTATGPWIETIILDFDTKNGAGPLAGLVFDPVGNLYGTASSGGAFGNGTVFQLSPSSSGAWTETLLHQFGNVKSKDGEFPSATLLLDSSGKDSAGNLYGTTYLGGSFDGGAVFKLAPSSSGLWTETILHSFPANGDADGFNPEASLTLDPSGNLFSTTFQGGIGACTSGFGDIVTGCGIVFELQPSGDNWTAIMLHEFAYNGIDGQQPMAGLARDSAGHLYGTTTFGGAHGAGTVFEITQ